MTTAHKGLGEKALAGNHRGGRCTHWALGQRTIPWGCSWTCLWVSWHGRRKQEWGGGMMTREQLPIS